MKHLLILISFLLLFSSIFISCSKSSDDGSSNTSTTTDDDTITINITITDDNSTTSFGTKQLGTSRDDWGKGVTTDSSGNIYVTGSTEGGLDGNTNSGPEFVTSSGNHDIFLVKYNSSGTKQWTKQLGTYSRDEGQGVTTDSSDNIYVTGFTEGGLDGNTNLGGRDIFLVKYN